MSVLFASSSAALGTAALTFTPNSRQETLKMDFKIHHRSKPSDGFQLFNTIPRHGTLTAHIYNYALTESTIVLKEVTVSTCLPVCALPTVSTYMLPIDFSVYGRDSLS
ncbi:hypothetical protein IWZ00DRAFT_487968 [Phyllosticta capitalensis]|uniref:Uncharacterized protein n=1 Tax=Phyllosticta capitalensis TaxID=121624 RepID=A0ABR1YWM7_9PEZI